MKSPLSITSLELGPLQTNCYIVAHDPSKKTVVVDPADDGERIARILGDREWVLERILLTHGHFDHIGGVNDLRMRTGAEVWIHAEDAEMLENAEKNFSSYLGFPCTSQKPDGFLEEDKVITLGPAEIRVLHTPGHSKGSVSFLGDGFVVVGDTLFQGGVGRSDFPGCSAELLLSSIDHKLMILPDETVVYPGHGPSTTIGRERKENPFLVGDQPYI